MIKKRKKVFVGKTFFAVACIFNSNGCRLGVAEKTKNAKKSRER